MNHTRTILFCLCTNVATAVTDLTFFNFTLYWREFRFKSIYWNIFCLFFSTGYALSLFHHCVKKINSLLVEDWRWHTKDDPDTFETFYTGSKVGGIRIKRWYIYIYIHIHDVFSFAEDKMFPAKDNNVRSSKNKRYDQEKGMYVPCYNNKVQGNIHASNNSTIKNCSRVSSYLSNKIRKTKLSLIRDD